MSTKLQNDEVCIAAWISIVGRFNELIKNDPPLSKVKDDLLKLKVEASNKNALNYRQTEAILARINHFLAGTYGTKKPENYNHSKTS